jgi:hypothetical protein
MSKLSVKSTKLSLPDSAAGRIGQSANGVWWARSLTNVTAYFATETAAIWWLIDMERTVE